MFQVTVCFDLSYVCRMVAVYFGAQLIKGGGGDAGHDGPNLHKLSNVAQLRLALPEPARELPGTPLSGWKRAGRLPRWVLQARTPVADPRFGRHGHVKESIRKHWPTHRY